ncbi:PIN-like domain-containing protein [Pseudomonas sp. p21]|uniref:PIN-like domain-containing protein n=1 Tax=Pseudomonas sp. p21 TaxID=1825979 RepID=UPI0007C80441|nr:PIN-like domain-containing protein [Pseudomonas sp. p21]
MLLGLNLLKKTKDEFLRELADLAKAPSTLIFIDTNILSYLFKLHAAARQEFFDWASVAIDENRFFLPAWCAGEYLARVKENQLHSYTPKGKGEQHAKALEAMLDTASLFVDDAVLRSTSFTGSRAEYLAGFREAINELSQYTQVFKHQFDRDKIHAEIEEFLGPVVLDSPIAQLCDRASKEGPSRIEHRLPPGFRDEEKPENRLGDLIIWLEILGYSKTRSADFTDVLFLTNDEKSDWVYAPAKRLDEGRRGRRSIPNTGPVLKIIDPRLVSEFKQEVGLEHVEICTLSTLVQGLSKTDPTVVGQLAAAIQIELVASDGLAAEVAVAGSEEPIAEAVEEQAAVAEPEVPEVAAEVPAQVHPEQPPVPVQPAPEANEAPANALSLAIQMAGLRDAEYQYDGPDELNEIINSLRSHNWYIQNPAILKLASISQKEFPATSWFVLGRNIYQAACGNAQKAMDFMANLDNSLRRFPELVSKYVLAGMLYEIYFDAQGELRQTFKAGSIAKPMSLVAKDGYEDVRAFIRAKLDEARANLFFYPGDNQQRTVVVQSVPDEGAEAEERDPMRVLTSVTLNGREILVAARPENHDWYSRFRSAFRLKDILDDISIRLTTPLWALDVNIPMAHADARFAPPAGSVLDPCVVLTPAGED